MGKKQRKVVADRLAAIPREDTRVILATGKYVGEGFDDPQLDTLFLTLPVSWRGTIAQYAGRLHRQHLPVGYRRARHHRTTVSVAPFFRRRRPSPPASRLMAVEFVTRPAARTSIRVSAGVRRRRVPADGRALSFRNVIDGAAAKRAAGGGGQQAEPSDARLVHRVA